jgi:predicted nuclease of predicted toxin-antitoxin system
MVARLFIALYLDEDVSVLVAELVRARGFDLLTTREAGRLHSTDEEQLAYAASQQRALLTHNRVDFELLHHASLAAGTPHGGIIIAVRHSPYEIVRRLLLILNHVTADEMDGHLRYI